MRRVLAHVRFLCAAVWRLNCARRALRPRLPSLTLQVRASAVALALWVRAASRQRIPIPTLRLMVDGEVRDIRVRDESEFFGSFEVFSTDGYAIDIDGPVRQILDLGANVGFAAMLLTERYPDAEIIAVEAAPDTFAALESNVAGLHRVHALHLAIGTDGTVHIDETLPSAERGLSTSGTPVPGVTLTQLLDDLGWESVDLMKIDVEGAEVEVFADPAMSRVRALVGEIHGHARPAELLPGHYVECNRTAGEGATMFRASRHQLP